MFLSFVQSKHTEILFPIYESILQRYTSISLHRPSAEKQKGKQNKGRRRQRQQQRQYNKKMTENKPYKFVRKGPHRNRLLSCKAYSIS